MKFTGERMIPEHNKNDEIYQEHWNRYFFASQFAAGKVVLDIACGSGYGCDLFLKSGAKKVVGVDISQETIDYCKNKYHGIDFLQGSVEKIPMEDKSVDLVVSFETIEHVDEQAQLNFMNEISRILKPDGMVLISTPNSLVYPKGNEFHIKELTLDEFTNLIKSKFKNLEMFYQDSIEADYIFSKKTLGGDVLPNSDTKINTNKINSVDGSDSMYLIAVCTNTKVPENIEENLVVSNHRTRKIYKKMHQDYQNYIDSLVFERDKAKEEIKNMKLSKLWKVRSRYISLKSKMKIK